MCFTLCKSLYKQIPSAPHIKSCIQMRFHGILIEPENVVAIRKSHLPDCRVSIQR